ncbi:MAG: acyl-CoA dehydrogenase family protein, partial [Rubrivivax sp.]|nr:acyl-CoA dehydrogenase family protein [Rubrivivax sp.]
MNFKLTEEQRAFCDAVRAFAEKHLRDGARARAHDPGYPWDVARLMAAQGLLGITIPEEHGGQGGTLMDAVLAIETIASVCPRSADVVQAGNFGAIRVLAQFASPEQRERLLRPLLEPSRLIAVG